MKDFFRAWVVPFPPGLFNEEVSKYPPWFPFLLFKQLVLKKWLFSNTRELIYFLLLEIVDNYGYMREAIKQRGAMIIDKTQETGKTTVGG